jgi:hypothetical protein
MAVLALTGQLADGDTFVLDGTTYEADDDSTVTAGNVAVDITANASVADDFDDLVAAVKANQGDDFRAIDGATYAAFVSRKAGPFDSAATVAAGATLVETAPDEPAADANLAVMASRAAVAGEVTQAVMAFALGRTPSSVIAQVRTAAGVVKAWDGVLAIDGEVVTLDNAGTTDWAATDVVTILAAF